MIGANPAHLTRLTYATEPFSDGVVQSLRVNEMSKSGNPPIRAAGSLLCRVSRGVGKDLPLDLSCLGLQPADLRPEGAQHLECDLRVSREVEEGLAWQLDQMELADRDQGCGARRSVEQAHLSEVVADAERAGGRLAERLSRSRQDDVERVGWRPLLDDDVTWSVFGECCLVYELSQS